jgi:hypothetical protein
MDDIISIYPDNVEISGARNSFDAFRKANPVLIVKAWHKFVYIPYNDRIEQGDLSYFIEKDYSDDLSHLKNQDKVMEIVNKIRVPIRNMSESNREHTTKYFQNLCKLAALYMESV